MATSSGGSKSSRSERRPQALLEQRQAQRRHRARRSSRKSRSRARARALEQLEHVGQRRRERCPLALDARPAAPDKSVQAFREALERSRSALESNVTVSRDRLQEVVDDAVKRGRMTRADANELVSNLVSRGRKATDDLMRDLERLLEQARKEVDSRTASTRGRRPRPPAGSAGRARDAADRPLAEADRLRRRAGAPGPPITGYDQLTAAQVKARLSDLNKADLRKVRTQEKRGKARQGVLDEIEKQLGRRAPRSATIGGMTDAPADDRARPPTRGRRARARDRLARPGRSRRRARRTATSSSSRGALPGDRVRARRARKAPVRRGEGGRAPAPEHRPDRRPRPARRRALPGRSLAGHDI